MNLHIVSRSACHRTMKEGSVIADCKRVDNQTCSVLQFYRIIPTFYEAFNSLRKNGRKVSMSYYLPKSVNQVSIKFGMRNTIIKKSFQIAIIFADKRDITMIKLTESFTKFIKSVTLFQTFPL